MELLIQLFQVYVSVLFGYYVGMLLTCLIYGNQPDLKLITLVSLFWPLALVVTLLTLMFE